MKEKLEIEDSFEEDEKDSEKQKNKTPVLNDSMKDINIKTIKTSLSIKFHDDEFCQNYQNRVAQQTRNILIRLTKMLLIIIYYFIFLLVFTKFFLLIILLLLLIFFSLSLYTSILLLFLYIASCIDFSSYLLLLLVL